MEWVRGGYFGLYLFFFLIFYGDEKHYLLLRGREAFYFFPCCILAMGKRPV